MVIGMKPQLPPDAVRKLIGEASKLDLGEHRTTLLERFQMSCGEADQGENHLAFECFCDNLYEYSIHLPPRFLQDIQQVGDAIGV
ncbi:MAG TPA: hypothetical protein VFW23_02995, partial [Tepidisphaeraceae bacterium]|nr:hypothetical protein [Tepidisphaeraceae bacterium]